MKYSAERGIAVHKALTLFQERASNGSDRLRIFVYEKAVITIRVMDKQKSPFSRNVLLARSACHWPVYSQLLSIDLVIDSDQNSVALGTITNGCEADICLRKSR